MHITHITEFDPLNPDVLSGTLYWITKSLEHENTQLHNLAVTAPQKLLPPLQELLFRCKQWWLKFSKKSHLDSGYHTTRALHIANILNKTLIHHETDVILSSLSPMSAAFLETKIPIVYWSDHVYGGVLGFHHSIFGAHHPDTTWDAHAITNACLMKAKLLIFSSHWAARTAIELYGISKNKIKIVPFGANIEITHTLTDIETMIKKRPRNCIRFLFVGKEWYRKGGDIVLRVTQELVTSGYTVEVTVVGCTPDEKPLPSYVKCKGKLSKKNPHDVDMLKQLYAESHFLFIPSRTEAFGIAFCEANAFGVPCIATHLGGIPDVVRDGINGMTFSLEATVKEYCDYITNLMDNYAEYETLALTSFNEYETRLNWKSAAQQVHKLISESIQPG